jgi:hypothetical protein
LRVNEKVDNVVTKLLRLTSSAFIYYFVSEWLRYLIFKCHLPMLSTQGTIMDKFDYSDLYKFLVSAGIVLIGLSVLLPWIYLRESFDLIIEKNKLLLLTEQAQTIIKNRQNLVSHFYFLIPKISLVLAGLGIISLLYGIIKWFFKQKDLDKRDMFTTLKLEKEVKLMDSGEIKQKNENEFIESKLIEADAPKQPIEKEKFITDYVHIEQFFIGKLTTFYQGDYTVLPNSKIGIFEYDLILSSKIKDKSDFIFEFKYFPNKTTHYGISQLLIRLNSKLLHYARNVKEKVNLVLIVVLRKEDYDELSPSKKYIKGEAEILHSMSIKVEYINENEIDGINKLYFDKVLFDE